MNFITQLFRVILGALFLYSGFTKCLDPQGFAYKLVEYLHFLHLDIFTSTSTFAACAVAIVEFFIGVSLLYKIASRIGITLSFVLMFFFTGLTLSIAISGKIVDCGCFGNEVILSNWATFFKNIVLFLMTALLFLQRKRVVTQNSVLKQVITMVVAMAFPIVTTTSTINSIPAIELKGYAIGSDISDMVHVRFDTNTHIYDNPVKNDNYTILAVIPDLKYGTKEIQSNMNALHNICFERGYNYYQITSSNDSVCKVYCQDNNLIFPIGQADENSLKNLMRPKRGGVVLIQNGTILGKWSSKELNALAEQLTSVSPSTLAIDSIMSKNTSAIYCIYILLFICVTTLYCFIAPSKKRRKRRNI